MPSLHYISSDSHVQEDELLIQNRVPIKYRHRVPHMEKRIGGDYFIAEGRKPRRFDLAEANVNEDDLNREFRDDPNQGRDVSKRLEDQARDNVVGEVIYCNSLLAIAGSPDAAFQMEVARAYND